MINKLNKKATVKSITISEGLSSLYDLNKLIIKGSIKDLKKSSKNIIREFNNEKWKELLNFLDSNPNAKLEELESIEDGDNYTYVFLNNKHLMAPPNWLRESHKSDIIKNISFFYEKFKFKKIVEIGAGYGSKIISLHLSSKIPKDFNYIALDISENGLSICRKLAKKYNLKLKTKQFDYKKQNMNEFKIFKDSLLFSCYGLIYNTNFTYKNLIQYIEAGIIAGVHIEPCSDLLNNLDDKLYANLALKYMIQNNYTLDIGKAFIDAKNKGYINLSIDKKVIGIGLLPTWIIKWRLKNK